MRMEMYLIIFQNADPVIQSIFRAVALRLQHASKDIETMDEKYENLRREYTRMSSDLERYKRAR